MLHMIHCLLYKLQKPHKLVIASRHILKPNPSMHILYWAIVELQSFAGSAALEKSMHSSRLAFSSLQTQHGYHSISSWPLKLYVVWCDGSGAKLTLGLSTIGADGELAAVAESIVAVDITYVSFQQEG